jgi:uncharacterized protein
MMATVLLMPGINNSGPTHWQSLWEKTHPACRRIQVDDWDRPLCANWVDAIQHAVELSTEAVIIVAHSLGCLPVVEWAMRGHTASIRALMLVSVPDPQGPNFPGEASGFSPLPLRPLPVRSIVVSSENDPFGSPDYARRCADAWGSRFINVGAAGHINANSGLGEWDQGRNILREFMEG